MSRNFTEREVFARMLAEIHTADGEAYQDQSTIYGDMSRLVVAWLAKSSPADLVRIYNELGWGGSANGRAMHEAARQWMRTYHPDRARRAGYGDAEPTGSV